LSDGISGKWVPDLLRFVTEDQGSIFDDKAKIEKEYYNKIYESMFVNKMEMKRELPYWVEAGSSEVIKDIIEEKIKDFGNTSYQYDDIKIDQSKGIESPEKIEKGRVDSMNLTYSQNIPGFDSYNNNNNNGNQRTPDFSNFRSRLI
jgi:hypothetical protein